MAVRKLRDHWWVDLRFAGKRHRKKSPLDTKGGAQAYETLLRSELAKHGSLEHLKPEVPAVTFAQFAERWMRDYVAIRNRPSEQSTKRYILAAHLVPRFGRLPLASVTAVEMHDFAADQRRKGLSAKTVNNQLTVLRRLLRTAEDCGLLPAVPRVPFLPAARPRYTSSTLEDVRAVAELCEPIFARMVLVALNTGLRYGELAALEWSDLDLARRELHVQRSFVNGVVGPPKNGRTRRVPLNVEALQAIVTQPRTQCPIIFQRFGRHISHDVARRRLRRAAQALGLEPFGWHALRHTFASELSRRGVSLQFVRDILGHATIDMTLRYAHLAPASLASAVAALDGVAAPALVAENSGQRAGNGASLEAPRPATRAANNEETGLWPVPTMVQRLGIEPAESAVLPRYPDVSVVVARAELSDGAAVGRTSRAIP